jgi:aerobic C4-dicarboxylate transport protein
VLLVSTLSGFAISLMGKAGEEIAGAIDKAARVFFGIIRIIVQVAPIGAFGAMAFMIGAYGLGSLATSNVARHAAHRLRAATGE